MQRVAATSCSGHVRVAGRNLSRAAPPTQPAPQTPQPSPPRRRCSPPAARVTLQASELTWVSLAMPPEPRCWPAFLKRATRRASTCPTERLCASAMPGASTFFSTATPIGTIGPHGKVREVVFKNGSYKVVPTSADADAVPP